MTLREKGSGRDREERGGGAGKVKGETEKKKEKYWFCRSVFLSEERDAAVVILSLRGLGVLLFSSSVFLSHKLSL